MKICFKVCAFPCYSMVDWLIEYEGMPQSLYIPMLFNGWLIDWIRGHASKSVHSHVIQWLIDWLNTRICLKVCAFPCYSMVDWLIEYEGMLQGLCISMLFNGWLIDWVRGYASKFAHFKNRYFPETTLPNSADSSLPMGTVIVLLVKQKWRQNLRWYL